jgi:penicillin-binding protein 1B
MAGLPKGQKPVRSFLQSRNPAILQWFGWPSRRSLRILAIAVIVPTVLLSFAAGYYYVSFANLIDVRLHGARQRVFPQIFARPLELHKNQSLTTQQLIDRLNDLGYAQRLTPEKAGEFAVNNMVVSIAPRSSELKGQPVRVFFRQPTAADRKDAKPAPPASASKSAKPPPRRPPAKAGDHVFELELGGKLADRLTMDTPLLTSLISGGEREKRRPVALSAVPPHLINAVLSIEDRRYYYHPGVDPIRTAGAILDSVVGGGRVSATSTLTQQLVRNVILPQFEGWSLQTARERNFRRKLLEQMLALVLETRASKDEILEMYLNDMPLGQRGSFSIIGFPEAARLFFGKDVSNVTLAEAATMAGVLQSPSSLSPFTNAERCRERRNVVLQAMVEAGYVEQSVADSAIRQPLTVVQRALETEAPHFVDYVTRTLDEDYPGLTTTTRTTVDVYTTLDLHLQKIAQDAVRNGLDKVDQLLSRRRKGRAEAALLAVDPRTGEILAMVGGRSYNQSQYNRAITASRQPGSVFKPFVYLTAFEEAATQGSAAATPATIVDDSPTTWDFNNEVWAPENYEDEYDGPITFRRALARSRNIATIKVAEAAGYDRVAALWKRLGVGNPPKAFPSIALGVFEATPFEIATAYTIFPNQGSVRPLRHVLRIESGEKDITKAPLPVREIARPASTYLVTNMMRSVLNEGTGAAVRGAGFALDAAGKTGTTNDLRDAWFVGFTPTLLTVVWVGFDENQPLGLSGSRAALPIWTEFMIRALAGTPNETFEVPNGITFATIDPDSGKLAEPGCPRTIREAFAVGTDPVEMCDLHH